MNVETVTDYAMPLMKIERMAKQIHDLCLERKYEAAREVTTHLGVEARILQATLALLEEKEKAFANTKVIQTQQPTVQSADRPDHAWAGAHGRGGLQHANGHAGNH